MKKVIVTLALVVALAFAIFGNAGAVTDGEGHPYVGPTTWIGWRPLCHSVW